MREKHDQRSGQECFYCAVVRTDSYCKEDVVGHVQQISMIESLFLSLPHCVLDIFATGKHVNRGDE